MQVNSASLIQNMQSILADQKVMGQSATKEAEKYNSFSSYFDTYLNIINETNQYQLAADKLQVDFAAGRTDDMLSVVLAQEKAYSSLNFTVQVTNKVIEAYREIMRIQM